MRWAKINGVKDKANPISIVIKHEENERNLWIKKGKPKINHLACSLFSSNTTHNCKYTFLWMFRTFIEILIQKAQLLLCVRNHNLIRAFIHVTYMSYSNFWTKKFSGCAVLEIAGSWEHVDLFPTGFNIRDHYNILEVHCQW
jgi:hypothetical protein